MGPSKNSSILVLVYALCSKQMRAQKEDVKDMDTNDQIYI